MTSTSRTITLRGQYGFAKLNNDIYLVQLDSSPAPRTYTVHVFRHDFVSVFPYSHTQDIACADLLEVLEDADGGWLEEDTATVFVTQGVMGQFVRLKDTVVPPLRRVSQSKQRPKRRTHDAPARWSRV